MKNYNMPEGSLWRRWDLHLHTPETRLANAYEGAGSDAAWDRFIDALEASPVQAFGITDYFGVDAYFKLVGKYAARYPDTEKALFPNIELRLAESISATGSQPHLHIIFDNNPSVCSPQVLGRFCTHLQTQAADGSDVRIRCVDLNTKALVEAATVSLDDVLKALEETFGNAKPYLLVFPANNDGLRSTDSRSPRKVQLADRIDKTCDAFFGNASNRDFLLRTDRYSSGKSDPKPVVSGSDAHSFDDLLRLSGDVAGFPSTWIKADLTFRGLQQICFEPEDRVFIGDEPHVLERQSEDGTKFLKTLEIDQNAGYDERNGKWFKGVSVPLNPELTAIIGNKGSCKSALVDILGLLGESRQEAYFSFLADGSKNKKFRQAGYAENFNAAITWFTGKRSAKKLSDKTDHALPETVRYLPQNYFEQLTNEIEIEKFRAEIEEVVFSHVEETDKLGKMSFGELEEFKTLQSKQEVSGLKKRLRELNIEIVRLETQGSAQFRKQLEGQKKAKSEELAALDAGKPKDVAKPDEATEEQRALAAKVNAQTALLTNLNSRIQKGVAEISGLKTKLQNVVSLEERLTILNGSYEDAIFELRPQIEALGLDVESIISLKIEIAPVSAKAGEIRQQLSILEAESADEITDATDFDKLHTLSQLRQAVSVVAKSIETLKESLSTPQRQYQAYVERLATWQKRRAEVLGGEVDPKPDTLRGIESQIRFLDENLVAELSEKREARAALVVSIFGSKRKVLKFYADLKHSVEERLSAVRTDGFSIEITASFVADRDFPRKFLGLINQRKKGPFRDNQEAVRYLSKLASETDWNDSGNVLAFADGLLAKMTSYNGEDLAIEDQAHDVKDLYDFLYSLEYFDAKYELRLSGKNLNELSPGEKGLLLLVFYLQLDRKNIPLVIDQPEDNLDNDSIFQVLAKCIREAKKVRQVVLVTHNPNLAVGADAEQIVYVKLDKTKRYQFSWESGAIENPAINQRIVDILEGSQPAFVKRRLKYGIA